MHGIQLAFHMVMLKQLLVGFLVRLHPLGMAGDQQLHEILGGAVSGIARDNDFLDVLVIEIADGSLYQIAFLVNKARRHGFQRHLAHRFPKPHEVFVVALDFGFRPFLSGGSDNDRHDAGNVEAG